MYKCEICGNSYENLEDRIDCEVKCLEARKVAEEKRKQAERDAEKETRRAEVEAAQQKYLDLLSKYVEDYGIFSVNNIFPHWTDYFLL